MASNGVTSSSVCVVSEVRSSGIMSSMIPKLVMYVVYVYMLRLYMCYSCLYVYVCPGWEGEFHWAGGAATAGGASDLNTGRGLSSSQVCGKISTDKVAYWKACYKGHSVRRCITLLS
jgi:hypothetical protein